MADLQITGLNIGYTGINVRLQKIDPATTRMSADAQGQKNQPKVWSYSCQFSPLHLLRVRAAIIRLRFSAFAKVFGAFWPGLGSGLNRDRPMAGSAARIRRSLAHSGAAKDDGWRLWWILRRRLAAPRRMTVGGCGSAPNDRSDPSESSETVIGARGRGIHRRRPPSAMDSATAPDDCA